MDSPKISRRLFLAGACSLAASPLITPVSFAATPGRKRFVTIILRGAMDGLYLLQPHSERELAALRPDFAIRPEDGLQDLDGHFGLHPEARAMAQLFRSGDVAFVNAVSTPYRNTRSHFDGQDLLESGGETVGEESSGWLNRALANLPGGSNTRAIDVSSSAQLILTGQVPVDVWAPNTDLMVPSDDMAFFERLYRDDPDFSRVFTESVNADGGADNVFGGSARGNDAVAMGKLTAGMLKGDYRVASFSIGGWDTHVNQRVVFQRALKQLDGCLATLKADLGTEIWKDTLVLALTEFGRTARQNGSRGTDHGTGGLAILAGGSIAGGRIHGDWPGLKESALLENRDLKPTGDIRDIAAHALAMQLGIGRNVIENRIFPGLDMSARASWTG